MDNLESFINEQFDKQELIDIAPPPPPSLNNLSNSSTVLIGLNSLNRPGSCLSEVFDISGNCRNR